MEAYLDWQKKSGGIKLNDVIEEYRYVAAGKQIKAGDLVNYINGIAGKTDYGESVDTQLSTNSNTGYTISAVKLDESRVFIAHSYGSSYYLYGAVCTINGAAITCGPDIQLSAATYSGMAISAKILPNGKVFVAHDYETNHRLWGMLVSIEGAEIKVVTDTQLSGTSNTGYAISTELLPNGSIFIAHSYNTSYHLYGMICTISDTKISYSDTAIATTSKSGYFISTCLLPNGNVFIAHSYGSSNYLYGIVVSISGTTITSGSDTALVSSQYAGSYISTCLLLNGNVFIAHSYSSGYYLQGRLISISGTTISELDNLILRNSAYTAYAMSTHLLPNGDVFIAHSGDFTPNETTYYLYGIIVSVSNNRIVAGTDIELINTRNAGSRISSLLLDNGTIFIAHSNSTSYYLNAQIWGIDYENNIPTNNIIATQTEQQVTPAIEPPFNAVALSSGVGGTDTEHNEQVKIARVYKEVVKTDNLFSKTWAKVSNTEYKADDGTIFAVPNNDGDLPLSNAFDGNEDTYTEGGDAGTQDLAHSFQVTLPQQIKITKMKIKLYTDTYTQYFSGFKIEGGNDGSVWNNLYQTSTMPSSGMNEYTLDNADYYKHYRIYATFTVDSSLKLYEWQTSEYAEVIQ